MVVMHPNWKALATVHFPRKQFVREGLPTSDSNKKPKNFTNVSITGEEAKRIYEGVVGSDHNKQNITISQSPAEHKKSYRHTSEARTPTSKWINSLMIGAQKNDIASLSSLIEDGCDINAVDQYGWTALMCAACAGAVDSVKLLLEHGADVNVKDRSGNTCLSLARRHGLKEVVEVLLSPVCNDLSSEKTETKLETFYCEACKQQFSDTTRTQHSTSTVHLLCSKPKLVLPTVYGIPTTNKGYQILLKGGWDREKGLGPEGSGHKFPLKTVLKRDREGFGAKQKSKARVTHTTERKESVRTVGRRAQAAALNKERRKERALRLALS